MSAASRTSCCTTSARPADSTRAAPRLPAGLHKGEYAKERTKFKRASADVPTAVWLMGCSTTNEPFSAHFCLNCSSIPFFICKADVFVTDILSTAHTRTKQLYASPREIRLWRSLFSHRLTTVTSICIPGPGMIYGVCNHETACTLVISTIQSQQVSRSGL